MSLKQKKVAVLDVLRASEDALSLVALLKLLGPGYSDRSVRRWLVTLVDDGLIERLGGGRSTRYKIILEPSSEATSSFFGKQSQEVLQFVRQPIFTRDPVAYNQAWFDEYTPNKSAYFPKKITEQLQTAGGREKNHGPAGTYARHIYNRLMIDLSYNSSRLEGNTYSLLDTQRLIIEGASATGKLETERVMILNHKEAIRHLVDSAEKLDVNETEIFTLHFLLADGLVAAQYAGKVRDYAVRTGGSTYMPSENPSQLKRQLALICQKAAFIKNPYEQSIFLLIHIAYLQAFVDVNKRTARLSANIPLIKNNCVPFSFNDINNADYASAMIAIYELNNVGPLIDLYVYSYLRTCKKYDEVTDLLGYDDVRIKYRKQRRELLRHIVINQLTGKDLEAYINTQANALIEEKDRTRFLEDINEDLNELSPQRIVGLGISIQQLNAWLQKTLKT